MGAAQLDGIPETCQWELLEPKLANLPRGTKGPQGRFKSLW